MQLKFQDRQKKKKKEILDFFYFLVICKREGRVHVHSRPEEGITFLDAAVTGSCECWELNLVLLTCAISPVSK